MVKAYQVYGLVCPYDHNIFYVGMSLHPSIRLRKHQANPSSSAWEYCQSLKADGLKPGMVFFGIFEEKEHAMQLELQLIRTIPHLHNKYGKLS